jgi:hypothetical protein
MTATNINWMHDLGGACQRAHAGSKLVLLAFCSPT